MFEWALLAEAKQGKNSSQPSYIHSDLYWSPAGTHLAYRGHGYGGALLTRLAGVCVQRGYTRLYQEHVTQAHEGCDFDFLQGDAPSPEPAIY